jgi:hypothetical protein
MNEQLERIEKMLRSQLKGAGHLWWIGGFVYGVTGNNDPFIILYPAEEKLNEKVVRVYPHDFKKLPAFIPTDVGGGDTEANPNKEQAKKRGIYHECPRFEIVTFDGKETQMGRERRFGDVLRLSRAAAEAVQGQPARPQGGAQPQPKPPQQQRPPAQQQASPPPPPPDAPAVQGALVTALPDYRVLAQGAKTATEFDYAAYMTLRNGVYDSVERVARARGSLVREWRPSPKANRAMLTALEVYRDKRTQAEGEGKAVEAAHAFAKREALSTYNEAIKRGGK